MAYSYTQYAIKPSARLQILISQTFHIQMEWLHHFYILLTVHLCIIPQIEPTWCTHFLNMFITFLYMFQATMCPSSGENTVPMWHLVLVTLDDWYAWRNSFHIPVSHLYRTNTRCCICTVFSTDDGHMVARNMYRKAINILRKFEHQVGSIDCIMFTTILTVTLSNVCVCVR